MIRFLSFAPSASHARALLVVAFGAALISLVWFAPFAWDDVHLIRPYTASDLRGVWAGTWDPDGIETPGYRPLTTWFNHARALALAEHVAMHHAFVGAMLISYVLVMMRCAGQLGMTPAASLVAGLLLLSARYTVHHYTWLSEGPAVLRALLVAVALAARLEGRPASSLLWLAIAGLVREDALAIAPALVLLRPASPRYVAGVAGVGIGIVALRLLFLGAGGAALTPLHLPLGLALTAAVGGIGATTPIEAALIDLWWAALAAVAPVVLRQRAGWPWMASAAGACLPLLAVIRPDLVLVPMTLFLFGLAAALQHRPRLLMLLACVGIAAGLTTGDAVREVYRDGSAAVYHASRSIMDDPRATIPAGRSVPAPRFTPRLPGFFTP